MEGQGAGCVDLDQQDLQDIEDCEQLKDFFSSDVGKKTQFGEKNEGERKDSARELWDWRMPKKEKVHTIEREGVRDILKEDAEKDEDLQGIPWSQLVRTREQHRVNRLQDYENFRNLDIDLASIKNDHTNVIAGKFFEFHQSHRRVVKSSYSHTQLRRLLLATSAHDLFFMYDHSIFHYSELTDRSTCLIDLRNNGTLITTLSVGGSSGGSWGVSGEVEEGGAVYECGWEGEGSVCGGRGLVVVGGFRGEIIAMDLQTKKVVIDQRISGEENNIINNIDLCPFLGHDTALAVSCNDSFLRILDLEYWKPVYQMKFDYCVNATSVSTDRVTMCVVGDYEVAEIVDLRIEKVVTQLRGHIDYSFCSAWHPLDSKIVATGNQDKCTRVWDLRYPIQAVEVLPGKMGAVRSLGYSLNGEYLYAAECADFARIYATKSNYSQAQEMDFFGEITGATFTPDSQRFYIGIEGYLYGCITQYRAPKDPFSSLFI